MSTSYFIKFGLLLLLITNCAHISLPIKYLPEDGKNQWYKQAVNLRCRLDLQLKVAVIFFFFFVIIIYFYFRI